MIYCENPPLATRVAMETHMGTRICWNLSMKSLGSNRNKEKQIMVNYLLKHRGYITSVMTICKKVFAKRVSRQFRKGIHFPLIRNSC
ncbi:hypothetical protein GDO81_001714 [Engystomops pustulosus]|uniref:Uncharacterized protein n=1 Tax=Engystomops pustulosus TaxID=76066 RepID=A0AAV7DF75_ENGPU|nr:hypothetical protein GDO81_001714 [Engystomops pustulosus]